MRWTACLGGVALAFGLAPLASAQAGGASAPSESGGTQYGAPLPNARDKRPVATRFTVTPRTVVAGGRRPSLALRIDQRGVKTVQARVVFWPLRGRGSVVRLDLGRVRTGRTVRPPWPKDKALAAGSYVVRLHATGAGGKLLRRARASGRVGLTVRPAPRPSAPPTPPVAPVSVVEGGVFPVGGPHTYGDGIGADRGDHSHQGQDVLAAEGLPVRAPTAGTITVRDYQAQGAGFYLVQQSVDGRHFFFAHCKKDTFAVDEGQVVEAGQQLCQVGSTGSSSAPHLHFEIWTGGWRAGKESTFVDPMPQLLAWDPDY